MNTHKAYFTYVDENNTIHKISYVVPYKGITKQMSIYQLIKDFEIDNLDIHIPPHKNENS